MKLAWKLEHYELLHSHKTLDAAAKAFMKTYPDISLSVVLNKWDHKSKSHAEHNKLKEAAFKPIHAVSTRFTNDKIDTIQSERLKTVRNIIVGIGIKDGAFVPWETIQNAIKPVYPISINSLKQLLTARGGYAKYSVSNPFADIIVKSGSHYVYNAPKTIPQITTPIRTATGSIMIPAKIVHRFEKETNKCSYTDDTIDTLAIKDHNLRAEQTQILKEILSALLKTNDLMITTMKRFDDAIEANKRKVF